MRKWTPNERANYMARIIREGRDVSERDTFSQCLECDEVDKVLQVLWEKAQISPKLKRNLFKYVSEWAFDPFRKEE